jgi:hypothetical protein
MPAFVSPLTDAAAWAYSIREITIGWLAMRYVVRALAAQRIAGADVVVPALGVLKRTTGPDAAGRSPGRSARSARSSRGWAAGRRRSIWSSRWNRLTAPDGQIAPSGDLLHAAVDVTIALVFQDRVTRDPALCFGDPRRDGGRPGQHHAVAAVQRRSGCATAWRPGPVLLDETGDPPAARWIWSGTGAGQSCGSLAPGDLGDLQRTVRRLNPADPGLWSGGTTVQIRPVAGAGQEFQLAWIEIQILTRHRRDHGHPRVPPRCVTEPLPVAPQFAIPTGDWLLAALHTRECRHSLLERLRLLCRPL